MAFPSWLIRLSLSPACTLFPQAHTRLDFGLSLCTTTCMARGHDLLPYACASAVSCLTRWLNSTPTCSASIFFVSLVLSSTTQWTNLPPTSLFCCNRPGDHVMTMLLVASSSLLPPHLQGTTPAQAFPRCAPYGQVTSPSHPTPNYPPAAIAFCLSATPDKSSLDAFLQASYQVTSSTLNLPPHCTAQ